MKKQTTQTNFVTELGAYKRIIDADIATYSRHVQKSTLQQYGSNARLEIDSFLSILDRGGKRIRGALVMVGYEMSGGTDRTMIIQAARAIEMLHAYILMIDDIQDRSQMRRGGPTAHVGLASYHKQHELAGDAAHFGVSIALMGALAGGHAAQMVLSGLNVDPELRLNVLGIVNRTMMITVHGQTNDIMNEVVADVTREDIDRVLLWKTAEYSFLNPLCVGMVLAGADCHATDAIRDYALHAGVAFQISDDILGIFGNEFESGKSPMDDLREGKRTVLVQYALEHASVADKDFLLLMLGNESISPAQFERSKSIIESSGALAFARSEVRQHIDAALSALDTQESRWKSSHVSFLRGLALYLANRTV